MLLQSEPESRMGNKSLFLTGSPEEDRGFGFPGRRNSGLSGGDTAASSERLLPGTRRRERGRKGIPDTEGKLERREGGSLQGAGLAPSAWRAADGRGASPLPQEPANEQMENGNSLGKPKVLGGWPESSF